jgi:fatty-acyl-CoA synthase
MADPVLRAAELWPSAGFRFDDGAGAVRALTFPQLRDRTASAAAGLAATGLERGDRVGLMLVEPEEFVVTFLAAIRLGVVPVPLFPPRSIGRVLAHIHHTAAIAAAAALRVLVVTPRLRRLVGSLVDDVPSLDRIVPSDVVLAGGPAVRWPALNRDDVAFLQFTSGSTGDPVGVVVTHACLQANAAAIVAGIGASAGRTVAVSWLPLYHDMGLIGFVITPLLHGLDVVLLPTGSFLRRPRIWLDAVHRHRGTATFAPAFAYALATRRATEDDLSRWDLSCLEVAGCGAEPIPSPVLRRFTELFAARCGLPETAPLPAYGLAEATLAVTMKPLGSPVRVTGRPDGEVISCGRPLPGVGVTVRDRHGRPRPDGEEGEIHVTGPSVTPGSVDDPRARPPGAELATGDLGFLLDGELHVTGRLKDLLILAGRNLHPQQVEWAAAEVEGVRRGAVVAFSVPTDDGERAVLVLEAADTAVPGIQAEVTARVADALGVALHAVVCVAPGTLPKTSSGKPRRAETRRRWLDGALVPEPAGRLNASLAVTRQLSRSLVAQIRHRRS